MTSQVLVIDDNIDVVRTVELILSDLDCSVAAAQDGKRGLVLFDAKPPDLVITDIVMPEKDGIETIVEMRRLRPDVKIIAISGGGAGMAGDRLLHMTAVLGADHVLEKPFAAHQLRDLVQTVLRGAQPVQSQR